MTDLMASVAVTFLLLAAIFMLRASDAKREAEQRKREAEGKITSVETIQKESLDELGRLVEDLGKRTELRDAVHRDEHDRFVLTVEFPEHALYFKVGSHELVVENAETLIAPLEAVVRRVCKIDPRLTNSIVLEGHTDPQGRAGDEGYQRNVRLSGERAQTVYFAVRRRLDEQDLRCVDARVTVSGRGPVQPKRFTGPWNDPTRPSDEPADRRVVLKIRFTSGGEALASARQGAGAN